MKRVFLILCCVLVWKTEIHSQYLVDPPGAVLKHIPKSSGKYIGSPSICVLPNGVYVASHDEFGPNTNEATKMETRIYSSADSGINWTELAVIQGLGWANLFFHHGHLYNIGTDKESGNLVIRKSNDDGKTWTEPTTSENGILLSGEYHTAPMPMLIHNGRIWRTVENASASNPRWGQRFSAMVISAPIHSDLLDSRSWMSSNHLSFQPMFLNGHFGGWLEGNIVLSPDGRLLNILRVDTKREENIDEYAALVEISDDGELATFEPTSGFINFPGGCKKFEIQFDKKSQLYWAMSNPVAPQYKDINLNERTRNVLALYSSKNLVDWKLNKVLLHHPDVKKHGFQYPSFQIDGEDLLFVSRTAFDDGVGGADNCHNANFLTFHRVLNFRELADLSADLSSLP